MTDADDPALPPASPLWRAWQGTSRANRLLAGGALAVLLGVGGAVLLTGDDEDEPLSRTTTAAASASPSPAPSPSAAPSVAPSPSAVASPSAVPSQAPPAAPPPSAAPAPSSAAPAPSPTTAPASLQLGGDELGVTRVGAPVEQALAALTRVLGPPVADPARTVACVGAGDREVEWAEFRLAVTDGVVSGWRSTDPALTTPSGVGIGTTVTEMQERYGDRLELFDPNPDSGPTFALDGVALSGALTGTTGDDRVTAFFNRACGGP